jgi:subtilisin family serine protease/protocatechuate 3,4-dioxygenase beta subunit
MSVVTVTARDAFNNPIGDAAVQLAATGSDNDLVQPTGTTSAGGIATGTLSSTRAELKTVSATINGVAVTQTALVTVTPAALSVTQSTVAAAPGSIAASSGGTASTITVTARDQFANPIGGATVQLAATGASNALTQPAAVTNQSGIATGTVSSTVAEAKTVSATINAVPITQTAIVTVTPAAVSAAQSTVVASPGSIAASSGAITATITVTALDEFGNPVSGAAVDLAATGAGNTLTQPVGTTNTAGVAIGALSSTVAAAKTVSATINTQAVNQVALVNVTPAAISASQSTVAAVPATIAASSGASASLITVTAKDQFGNPVSGATVTLDVTGAGNTLSQPPVATNDEGVATGSLSSTVAQAKTVSATINALAIDQTAGVTVTPGPVSAAQSTVMAAPTTIIASSGGTASTITVTAKDQFGNLISGASVTLAATGAGNTLVQPAATDASGVATGTLSSTAAQTKTVSATIGGTAVTQAAIVTVTAAAASSIAEHAGNGQSATVNTAVATDPAVIVRDEFGNPVSAVSVTFTTSGGGSIVPASPATLVTDDAGTATLTSWTLGTTAAAYTVNAVSGSLVGSPVVFTATATPGPPSASQSSVSAAPGVITASTGTSSSTVTVTVRDQFNNPVPGASVELLATGTDNALVQPVGTTNQSGVASGSLSSTKAEAKTVSAKANGLAITQSSAVFVIPGPVSAAQSSVVAAPVSIVASLGASASTITVTARDQFSNPINGATVTLAATGSLNALTQPAATTSPSGVATGTLSSRAAEAKTVSATIGAVAVTQTAVVTVGAAAAAAIAENGGNLQSATVNTPVPINPSVLVRDEFNNPVADVVVTFAVTGGGGSLLGTNPATTSANGTAHIGWAMGGVAGPNALTATAAALSGSPVTFTATALAGAATTIALSAGDAQTDTVGATLATPYAVLVTDGVNPVQGVTVAWLVTGGGGSISPASSVTDVNGIASAQRTLSPTVGAHTATASAGGLTGSPVAFTASATAGAAAALTIDAGNAQTAPAGTALPVPMSVKVADAHGNGVAGVAVDWLVVSGGGSVSTPQSSTNAGGIASAGRTLGPSGGTHTASATVASLSTSVLYSATATPNGTISGTVSTSDEMLLMAASAMAPADATALIPPALLAKGIVAATFTVPTSLARGGSQSPQAEYLPDELIVTYRSAALGAPSVGSALYRARARAQAVGTTIRSRLAPRLRGNTRVVGVSPVTLAARIKVDPSELERVAAELRADPAVLAVGRNAVVTAAGDVAPRSLALTVPNDPLYPWQAWHYTMIDLPRAWDITRGSASVIVAVVDDGIRFDHPAIAGNLTADGYDFVSSVVVPRCGGGGPDVDLAGDGGGYDPDPTNPIQYLFNPTVPPLGCWLGTISVAGHGLHVASTIGAVGNDATTITGVNWTVRIRPVRVLNGAGRGSLYDVAQGVLYAAGLPADDGAGGVVQAATPARIINMSLGTVTNEPVLANAVTSATSAGSLIIAAAGNNSSTAIFYPALYPEVLSVAAVGPTGAKASYSSFGPSVDIAAPGGDLVGGNSTYDVYSAMWDFVSNLPTYGTAHGTSMATPHVSGVAALLLADDPSLTSTALRARLTDYAIDLGAPGRDDIFGAGLVNARNSLTQSMAPPSQLFARLLDAVTGGVVQTVMAQGNGSYAFTGLADGSYWAFAGQDADGDAQLGVPGRRWGALGGSTAPTTVTVAGAGTYPASFTIGLPGESEPNASVAEADVLALNAYVQGSISSPGSDNDVYAVRIAQAGQYTFETVAVAGACGFALEEDTELNLSDALGTPLASNDDVDAGALQYCSRITTVLNPGLYHVQVSGSLGGRYRVRVRNGS